MRHRKLTGSLADVVVLRRELLATAAKTSGWETWHGKHELVPKNDSNFNHDLWKPCRYVYEPPESTLRDDWRVGSRLLRHKDIRA